MASRGPLSGVRAIPCHQLPYHVISCHTIRCTDPAQIAAAVKYFFLPAWRTERDALDAWPISLKRKTQNPLNELFGADGSRIGWEDSEGPEDPKPSRFFLFKEFAFRPSDNTASGNVFNSMQPGTNHPGELDSPVWKPKDAKPLTA